MTDDDKRIAVMLLRECLLKAQQFPVGTPGERWADYAKWLRGVLLEHGLTEKEIGE